MLASVNKKTMRERSAKSSVTPSLGIGGCRQEGGGVYNGWPVRSERPCSKTNLLPPLHSHEHTQPLFLLKNTQKSSWDVFTVAGVLSHVTAWFINNNSSFILSLEVGFPFTTDFVFRQKRNTLKKRRGMFSC